MKSKIRESVRWWLPAAGLVLSAAAAPSVDRQLRESDYDAGFVLSRIGTGERFDFDAPEGAVTCTDWLAFGASRDWFRLTEVARYRETNGWSCPFGSGVLDSLTVFSSGMARVATIDDRTSLSPFETELGIVPKGNWKQLTCTPSRFWYLVTPSNSLVMTWQNVLLNREVEKPVSVQAELFADGSAVYRYDLSRVTDADCAAVKVGMMNGGKGRSFVGLDHEITSLSWARLDPKTKGDEDPDGDGLSTTDELFTYGTNPYAADSDGDGLSDYAEVITWGTDPNQRCSLDGICPDGWAVKLEGRYPFSGPDGSYLTHYEHLFYGGDPTSDVYPPEGDSLQAILRIGVEGKGTGVLTVGDQTIPLAAGMPVLKIALPWNTRVSVKFDGPKTLRPILNSDSFGIGELPGDWWGAWLEFPRLTVSPACIHTTDSNEVEVSLDVDENPDDFTCTWTAGDSVEVENLPPRSALLSASFVRDSSGEVTYRVSHPKYVIGSRDFVQTCRYCPQIMDEEVDGEQYLATSDYDDRTDERWCWCWSGCPGCECSCHDQEDVPASGSNPEECPEHDCDPEECETLHSNEYVRVRSVVAWDGGALKLHKPLSDKDRRWLHISIPSEVVPCCECPEHWGRRMNLISKSRRLAVHIDGEPFVTCEKDCEAEVYGVAPSDEFGDATFALSNGDGEARIYEYTVFGVGVFGDGYDLSDLNRAAPGFGVPVAVQTNFAGATGLKLRTDVKLSNGSIRLAFGPTAAKVELWVKTWDVGARCASYVKLIDSDSKPTLDMSVARWRRLVAYSTEDRETKVLLMARAAGSVDLTFAYSAEHDGVGLYDEAVQRITAIPPLLVPDIDRDGVIDEKDAGLTVDHRFRFWTNQDIWKGDDAFDLGFYEKLQRLTDGHNGQDERVNGRNDLVNLLPLGIRIRELVRNWGGEHLEVVIRGKRQGEIRWCFSDGAWSDARGGVCGDVTADAWRWESSDGELLSGSKLDTTSQSVSLPEEVLQRAFAGRGMLYLEGTDACTDPVEVIVNFDGEPLFVYTPQLTFSPVDEMYRWHDMRGFTDGSGDSSSQCVSAPEPKGLPDDELDDSDFYFVHGYNVSEQEAREWGRAMFKRLWWSGLRSRFHVVTWYGNDSQIWVPLNGLAAPDYHVNVEHAIKSAEAFDRIVAKGHGRQFVAAHSLGNMLVSAAIQDFGTKLDRYFMLNAAVASEAYDPSSVGDATVISLTPPDWSEVPLRYRATHWFEWEAFEANDVRRTLTWRNRFSRVGAAVNYYSSEEEVLKCDPRGENHAVLQRDWAWYNQERNKGRMPIGAGRNEGGWEYNSRYRVQCVSPSSTTGTDYYYRDPTPAEVAAITEDLRVHPVFSPLEGDVHGASPMSWIDPDKRTQYLADGIPAESYPAGFAPVPTWDGDDSVNINVAEDFKGENSFFSDEEKRQWGHSYFLGAPYMTVYRLFDDIINKIKESE